MPKSPTTDLLTIPGVGPRTAEDLIALGVRCVADLRNNDPQRLYEEIQQLQGGHVDRCVLYVFRCAVYYASNKRHDPELLKWWNWKDRVT